MILINIYIVKSLILINYNKYLPDNKLGHILNSIINRYIKFWSKSIKLALIVSYSGIILSIIMSNIFMYFVMHY